MFWRKPKAKGAANRLSDEAERTCSAGTRRRPRSRAGQGRRGRRRGRRRQGTTQRSRPGGRPSLRPSSSVRRGVRVDRLERGGDLRPNGEAVASLLDSMSEVDYETAEAIADAYEAIPEAERKVARSVVRRRHRGGGLDADLWAAEHAVSDWLAAMQLEGDERHSTASSRTRPRTPLMPRPGGRPGRRRLCHSLRARGRTSWTPTMTTGRGRRRGRGRGRRGRAGEWLRLGRNYLGRGGRRGRRRVRPEHRARAANSSRNSPR